MYTMNRAELIGHLGADPSIHTFQNGTRVCKFSVATKSSWKDKDGNWKNDTQWHAIVIYDKYYIGLAEKYLVKGSKAFVSGVMEYRDYEKHGQKHTVAEIVLRPYGGGTIKLLDSRADEDCRADED